jgi:AcrR family transcriptional regulator
VLVYYVTPCNNMARLPSTRATDENLATIRATSSGRGVMSEPRTTSSSTTASPPGVGSRVGPGVGSDTGPDPVSRRGAGRPRDERVDRDVLEATRVLLVEVGYASLTIDAIARRANVSRPAIYRRWKSKAQLVHEAVYPADDDETFRFPESDDFAADLRAIISTTLDLFRRPEVLAAVPGLLAEQRDDPELRHRLVLRLEADARADFDRLVQRAVERGGARAGLRGDVLFDTFVGAALFRVSAAAPDEVDVTTYAEQLTDLLLHATTPTNPSTAATAATPVAPATPDPKGRL